VLDSGAFSALNLGMDIDLQEYIDFCKQQMADRQGPAEIFTLDVIGDWKASLKNTEEMWKQGVPVIPCFHEGEPWDALLAMARDYPKIALGGMVGEGGLPIGGKAWWLGQCFARVWPKKIHGFGIGGEKIIMSFPFHSVDASNWIVSSMKYGSWISMKYEGLSIRRYYDIRAEVDHFLRLEARARNRWAKELAMLDQLGGAPCAASSVPLAPTSI
jgi:hypothetical protein